MRTIQELEKRILQLENEKHQKDERIQQLEEENKQQGREGAGLKTIDKTFNLLLNYLANVIHGFAESVRYHNYYTDILGQHDCVNTNIELPMFDPDLLAKQGVSIGNIRSIVNLYGSMLSELAYSDWWEEVDRFIRQQPYFILHNGANEANCPMWTHHELFSSGTYSALLSRGHYDIAGSSFSIAHDAIQPNCGEIGDTGITEEQIQLTIAMSNVDDYQGLSDIERKRVENCSLDWKSKLTFDVIQSRFNIMFERAFDHYFVLCKAVLLSFIRYNKTRLTRSAPELPDDVCVHIVTKIMPPPAWIDKEGLFQTILGFKLAYADKQLFFINPNFAQRARLKLEFSAKYRRLALSSGGTVVTSMLPKSKRPSLYPLNCDVL